MKAQCEVDEIKKADGTCDPCDDGYTTNVPGGSCEIMRWGIELNMYHTPLVYGYSKPGSDRILIAPNATVLGGNQRFYDAISITIDRYSSADGDTLALATFPALNNTITATFADDRGILLLKGLATGWEYTQIIRQVEFFFAKKSSSGVSEGIEQKEIEITISLTELVLCGDHLHFYEFIEDVKSWEDAKILAEKRNVTIGDVTLHGYLATITSQEENDCITNKVVAQGWIGATDKGQEGYWRWVTGPEGEETSGDGKKGRLFWVPKDGTFGEQYGTEYSNWAIGEPNNSQKIEHYAQIKGPGENPGKWNDLPNSNSEIKGYFVEYSTDDTTSVGELRRATTQLKISARMFRCHGELANKPSVCGGRGQCVGENICLCNIGFIGDMTCECPEGNRIEMQTSTCVACEPGFYQNETDAIECWECPKGSISSEYGSTRCTQCQAGYFQNSTASTECIKCPLGFHSINVGSDECVKCPNGHIEDETLRNTCLPCPDGFSISRDGESCTACAIGMFSRQDLGGICLSCPPGSHASKSGSAACSYCASGYYQDSGGQSTCKPCPAGYINESPSGSRRCKPCPRGFYAALSGSAICIPCDNLSFAPHEGSTSCKPCPMVSISNGTHCQMMQGMSVFIGLASATSGVLFLLLISVVCVTCACIACTFYCYTARHLSSGGKKHRQMTSVFPQDSGDIESTQSTNRGSEDGNVLVIPMYPKIMRTLHDGDGMQQTVKKTMERPHEYSEYTNDLMSPERGGSWWTTERIDDDNYDGQQEMEEADHDVVDGEVTPLDDHLPVAPPVMPRIDHNPAPRRYIMDGAAARATRFTSYDDDSDDEYSDDLYYNGNSGDGNATAQ